MNKDLKKFFPDEQGWQLFQAACRIADDSRVELEKARSGGTLADAIAKAMDPVARQVSKSRVHPISAEAVRKATENAVGGDITYRTRSAGTRKEPEYRTGPGDVTPEIRKCRADQLADEKRARRA